MTGLKVLAASALLALTFATTARADSSQCVIGGDQGPCQSTSAAVSPRETQVATYMDQRALGCVEEPCKSGNRDYACTFFYTATVKQCSTCCSLESETKHH